MGLDVYLKKYDNKELSDELEEKYEDFLKKNYLEYGDYDNMTEEQKKEARGKNKEYAEKLGLDDWGRDSKNIEDVEFDSEIDKEHYFKIGYFRSSYNESGINRVLSDLDLPTLNCIFQPNDEYCFRPDWERCLLEISKLIKDLQNKPNYRCEKVSYNEFSGHPNNCKIDNSKEAMKIFLNEIDKERNDDSFQSYSNKDGLFHLKGIKVYGIIQGVNKRFFSDEKLPCNYLITKGENDRYITALKIVKETIEFVLKQKDSQKYYLTWSG